MWTPPQLDLGNFVSKTCPGGDGMVAPEHQMRRGCFSQVMDKNKPSGVIKRGGNPYHSTSNLHNIFMENFANETSILHHDPLGA